MQNIDLRMIEENIIWGLRKEYVWVEGCGKREIGKKRAPKKKFLFNS